MNKLTLIITLLLPLTTNAKWIESDNGLHHLMNLDNAKIVDISSQAFEYPKVITSISVGKKFYRCISWVRDIAYPEPEPEKCWLLTSDN
jgi:queuine/archaeosine tRNA-ribosyltransferase